ncbi:MAG: STAS domain-containing protein [Pseudomonadales bacterium]|nr:STAS domain-containing protein [Pseudomonadales bacterium]
MINARSSNDGKELVIDIDGRFDFSVHQQFRDAYEYEKGVERFCLDMKKTTYLDSAALGMLLLIRDFGGGEKAMIRIINCNEDVKNILTVSSFDQLFSIS